MKPIKLEWLAAVRSIVTHLEVEIMKRTVLCLLPAFLSFSIAGLLLADEATGVVYHDINGDGAYDQGDLPLKGICVSNGREVISTDDNGCYKVPITGDDIIFVIKPRGWKTLFDQQNKPKFYYIHKPAGSPSEFEHAGVAPTGDLPKSIDFPLTPQQEPEQFKTLLIADPQTKDLAEVGHYTHDVLEDLVGTDAAFAICLGDIVHNDLSLLDSINQASSLVGIPWYNVIGNHDLNFESKDDVLSDETFERIYGPNYYSFNYGPVHFLVLDDIEWFTPGRNGRAGSMRAALGDKQLEFIKNDLANVPNDQLVVLTMHAPIYGLSEEERQKLFRLIETHPHTVSISAHIHRHIHRFFDRKDGWMGNTPHHHMVTGAACGMWWKGFPDERGIPHAMMSDGTPNGYAILTVDGSDYQLDFRAAHYSPDYQMEIMTPEEIAVSEIGSTDVYVNVFNGTEKSKVEMQWGSAGEWVEMTKVEEVSPNFRKMITYEASTKNEDVMTMSKDQICTHLWKAKLPAGACHGAQLLKVRTVDMHGREFEGCRIMRIVPEKSLAKDR